MIKNHIGIAFRLMAKHKGFSFINIAGLAVGMAVCILIMLWVQDELNYDRFHEKTDRLFRIVEIWKSEDITQQSASLPVPLALAIRDEIPEVASLTRFDVSGTKLVKIGDQKYQSDIQALADPEFFEMFSFPIVRGDRQAIFADPQSVVITESLARKYFGDRDPLGETINIDRRDFTVTGVITDLPHNTHFKFDFVVPFDSRPQQLKDITDQWFVSAYSGYVQLVDNASPESVAAKIGDLFSKHHTEADYELNYSLQPITRIHLYRDIEDYLEGHGSIKNVQLFSALALLVLLVACINFINLTTARSSERAREVGVRKILGATRSSIARQSYCESIVVALIAFACSLVLVEVILPSFNAWAGKDLTLDIFGGRGTFLGLLLVVLATGTFSGAYIALYLSAFQPLKILKGYVGSRGSAVAFRRVLVVVQFTISICLMVCISVVLSQLRYIEHRPLGFDKDNILLLNMRGGFADNYQAIKNELLARPDITHVTAGRPPVRGFFPAFSLKVNGQDLPENINLQSLPVDYDYMETYGLSLIEGRALSEDNRSGLILTESAVELLSLDDPLHQQLTFTSHDRQLEHPTFEGEIVGVIKDFHNRSLHQGVLPVVMYYNSEENRDMSLKISAGNGADIIAVLDSLWNVYAPDYAFEYSFIGDVIDDFYTSEKRLGQIFGAFAVLAVIVSCLGLFGLASFTAESRTKEVGIRKVLGAPVLSIVRLFSKEFFLLVTLANVFAWPIAYYAMHRWLENFAYRAGIGWHLFLLSGLAALLIALLTVSYQTIRASRTDPVKTLRYE